MVKNILFMYLKFCIRISSPLISLTKKNLQQTGPTKLIKIIITEASQIIHLKEKEEEKGIEN